MDLKEVSNVLANMANTLNLIPTTKEGKAFVQVLFILNLLNKEKDLEEVLKDYDRKKELWKDKIDDFITAYIDMKDMMDRQDWVQWSEEAEQRAIENYTDKQEELLSMIMKGEMFNELTNPEEN